MKTVKLSISETLRYQREMVIGTPDDMTESELKSVLDKAQVQSQTARDVPFVINRINDDIIVHKSPDDSLNSPWNAEIEIDDYDIND